MLAGAAVAQRMQLRVPYVSSFMTFMLATAAATTVVPYFSSPVKNSPCDIYGCGGGLHVASINAPQLLEIYCC